MIELTRKSDAAQREKSAESLLAAMFEKAHWEVQRSRQRDRPRSRLVVRRREISYAVEVKAGSEGRGDRLVPLLAQAVLQSARGTGRKASPLAVVAAPKISPQAAEQALRFAEDYAPNAAVGVIDFDGLRQFRGLHLEEMNAQGQNRLSLAGPSVRHSGHLFSDLNQWMLKVLLASELPDRLLSAPRAQYRNASQLARAANVSVMSAFRFVQQLEHEGYLRETGPYLSLVRRENLFSRWQALSLRSTREVAMRFVLPGDVQGQLRKVLATGRVCLGLFAAADALQLGFVRGVPPYLYVQRVEPASLAAWKNLRRCTPGESPDVIVRQAPAPQSVFRGMVRRDGMPASDVLQVWIDVAANPSRGREQAELIRRRVLQRVIETGR